MARDQWPERAPSYRDVFQTIEGGMGFWTSNQSHSTTPKFIMNGTATVLMQDVLVYSPDALYNSMKAWSDSSGAVSGRFDLRGAATPSCMNEPLKFDQHGVPLTGFERFVETTMVGRSGSCSFGLKWKGSQPVGFPQYFKQEGDKMVAVPASQVPAETGLPTQTFAPATPGKPYTSPSGPGTAWTTPGPKSGPFTAALSDGSQVTYYWYRFVDQPALQHLNLAAAEKASLQALIERIQANWPITRDYMAPPSSGTLATLDSALIVTPPNGMEVGYVPVVTRQEQAHSGIEKQGLRSKKTESPVNPSEAKNDK